MYSGAHLTPRQYLIPLSSQKIVISRSVLDTFSEYRQSEYKTEAGGLLFAKFELPLICVEEASPPHATDGRWRTFFIPDRLRQRRLIFNRFKEKDLHFIGEWHSHPVAHPSPSSVDLESVNDSFLRSNHELNYFLMVIVGNNTHKLDLWVSAHNATQNLRLHESPQQYV